MKTLTCVLAFASAWIGHVSVSNAQLEALAGKVHRGANVVVAMDVAALKTTDVAKSRGWTKTLETAFVDREIYLPPEAEQLIMAAETLPGRNFERSWECVVMKMASPVSMQSIARAERAPLEDIRGKSAVCSSNDAYLAALDASVLGMYSPASRQAVAQWIGEVGESRSSNLSPYLTAAVRKVGPKTQIILAIDLADALSPKEAAEFVKQFKSLQGAKLSADDVAKLASSLKGATVEISVGSKIESITRFEFDAPVSLSKGDAKALVLESFEAMGVAIGDLAGHQFSAAGHSIFAEGTLSSKAMRRLMSLMELPTDSVGAAEGAAAIPASSSSDAMAKASLTYFKTVVSLLDDLRSDRDKQNPRGGDDAVWMERYAKKIDRLPILNVDEALLDWGSQTAQTMRGLATARRTGSLIAGAQKSALRTGFDYYGGGTTATDTALNASQIDRQQGNAATIKRVQGWQQIDDATAEIRRKMTKTYQIEF